MTIRGLAIGLTIWFSALGVLLFLAVQMRWVPDVPLVQILFLYSYYLLPVRWGLVLTMLIRGARAMPPRGLPHPIKIALFVVVQLLLGFFSFVGLYAMADQRGGKTGDHIFGFIMHVVVPSAMVAYVTRRATVEVAAPPAADVAHTG